MFAFVIALAYIGWCAYRTYKHSQKFNYTWRRGIVFFFSPIIDLTAWIGDIALDVQDELWS